MTKSLKQRFIDLWFPTFITSIMVFIFNLTDSYLVSTISENAVAAIGLITPFILISDILFYSVAGSFARFLGQLFGANKINRIKKKIFVGVSVSLLFGVILFLLLFVFRDYAYQIFHSGDNIKYYFDKYYDIWVFTIIFNGVGKIYSFTLNSISQVKIVTKISFISILLNVVISYILIFGYLGMPKLGIEGAAIGTLVASLSSTILYFFILFKQNLIIFKINLKIFIVIFNKIKKYIFPSLVSGITLPFGLTVLTIVISHFKDFEIASFTLAHRADLFWFMGINAFSSTYNILGNQALGAKKEHELNLLYKFTLSAGSVWALMIFVISLIFGKEIGELFFSNPETIDNFAFTLPFTVSIYIFWNIIASTSSLLYMLGKPYYSSAIGISRTFSMYIIFPLLGAYFFGYIGLLYGYSFGVIPPFLYTLYLLKYKQDIIKFSIDI